MMVLRCAERERVKPWWGKAVALTARDQPYTVTRPSVASARMQTVRDPEGQLHQVAVHQYAVLVRDVPDVAHERET